MRKVGVRESVPGEGAPRRLRAGQGSGACMGGQRFRGRGAAPLPSVPRTARIRGRVLLPRWTDAAARAFAPTAVRNLTVFGAEAQLVFAPERASREGRP